ncbi:MAG: protein translocase subunit SecD, partial [Planctomycetes bacterium]|nr:protein translocase subunit SecD [Planctomycetota bacterium]
MKRSYTWKVVLIIVIVALAILGLESKPIRRGIDLRGGAELLFRIDTSSLSEKQQLLGLTDKTVDIIRERIDPTGERGLVIQSRDQHRIMMQLPGFSRDQTKEIIALATNMGKLQWRLVANDDPTKVALLEAGKKVPGYEYYKYAEGARRLMIDRATRNGETILIPEGLLIRVDDKYNITGELLSRVQSTVDRTGGPAVLFEMKPEGARRFGKLTGDHQGERLAIILNDQLYSAPTIQDKITDRGVITNIPSAKERDNLVKVLNSGSLKAPLILESEQYVGPTLGARTIQRGVKSGIIAGIVVLVFMVVYYLVAGSIADFALCLNILVLLSVMAVSRATLTLPGIAGIVLTVGMAVDANVLIFERIREELRMKRDLPVAIRMGYEKAFTAIFDSNLTTFATAAILYVFGTGPVRGFAITLSIGILVSFFTAVFVTRVIFELLVKHNLVKQVKM